MIAQCFLEMISAEVAIAFQMPNDRFNHTAAPEFFFDDAEDTPLLSRTINTVFVGIVVTAISAIHINALGFNTGDVDHVLSHGIEGMAIERSAM